MKKSKISSKKITLYKKTNVKETEQRKYKKWREKKNTHRFVIRWVFKRKDVERQVFAASTITTTKTHTPNEINRKKLRK